MTVKDRTRAILLTTQRTGSTFLIECLASHPDIESTGELLIGAPDQPTPFKIRRFRTLAKTLRFVRSGAWRPARRMEAFFTGGSAQVRVFKVMYNQISRRRALDYLCGNTDIKILHLRRHNQLKMYVSKMLMGTGKRVQSWEPLSVARIRIDPAAALEAVRNARRQHEHFETVFAAHPRLDLVYEELIEAQTINPLVAGRICDFLEIERKPMRSRLVKVNPNNLADIVVNYEEIVSAFSSTEFSDMLD